MIVLYFDGDILRKEISCRKNGGFRESSYNLKTQNDRTMIAPITAKGKPKKLNGVNIQRCRPYGTYMDLAVNDDGSARVIIGNYDTEKSYYNSGYGRILFDVYKWVKSGGSFWNILMGRPVCVSIYHIVTENPDVSIEELTKLDCCPSEYIMDNILYYGECEIIGNGPLPEEIDYPVMYGRSIDARDRDKLCLSIGKLYKEIPLPANKNKSRDFINNSIGFWPHINLNTIKECVEAKSNEPYWKSKGAVSHWVDLRDPQFVKEFEEVKKEFNLYGAKS